LVYGHIVDVSRVKEFSQFFPSFAFDDIADMTVNSVIPSHRPILNRLYYPSCRESFRQASKRHDIVIFDLCSFAMILNSSRILKRIIACPDSKLKSSIDLPGSPVHDVHQGVFILLGGHVVGLTNLAEKQVESSKD
jgi:hypothetical protein